MNWFYYTLLTWIQLFSPFFIVLSGACWGPTSSNIGDATRDYDLLVGSELDLNCTLNSEDFLGISSKVNSSNLVFIKNHQDYFQFTRIIDSRTAQLIIPSAQESDSGMYHCTLSVPEKSTNPLVCSTQVSVGYPPKNVSNFKCISKNFDNLTCTWDIEPNKVKTNYSLQKNLFAVGVFQVCPTHNNTFCQWRDDTDPPYQTSDRNLYFNVRGNNSLGISNNEFMLDHFEIVIPNSPENLIAPKIGKNFIVLQWLPPTMNGTTEKLTLFYQLWLEELGPDPHDRIVINIGLEKHTYIVEGLIPYYLYNISLRCRSEFALQEEMWSPIISLSIKTLADVPSVLPEVNSLAYELYNFEDNRNATLYWKPVSERHYNGKNFHYHVVYYPSALSDEKYTFSSKSKLHFITIGHLNNDSAYIFKIYSANEEGFSTDYKEIYIAERSKILPSPYDTRAISNERGYYNMTWSMAGSIQDYSFTVFWCSNSKSSTLRCNGPIQWSNANLEGNSFILNVTDVHINFQFAVVAAIGNKSSGMQWASCIVPQKAPLGKIPIKHIEQKDATTLKIIWSLDCEAMKSVIDRYEITYCKLGTYANCKVAKAHPDDESFILTDLQPFSNYSVKLRAFNKENRPSEDMRESYQNTLPGAPSDAPRNIQAISKSGTAIKIRWQQPLEPNGIISHYYLYYNGIEQYISAKSLKNLSYDIEGLSFYTNYSISMAACVSNLCSPKSQPVAILTDVDEPGTMDPPRIELINSTSFKVSWTAPLAPNGPIDFYVVKWQLEGDNQTYSQISLILSTVIETDCSTAVDGGVKYLFYVQASNIKNEKVLKSPFSEPTRATACIMSQGLALMIGLAIGGTLSLAFFMVVFYKMVKWMHDKIHQMKNIAVRLPKELEGPELNPLSNYESFKNGCVQKHPNTKADRLSYIFEENENKNRHGSGSSQFSNSSADELVFKNGKCTKFGRKPSGDSSGCSSMSSNTTTRIQLSSDSGTESDLPIPASPDSLLMEHSSHSLPKPPMPILVEQESLDINSLDWQGKPFSIPQFKEHKFISFREQHPYSKFGISGVSSSVPWGSNSFAFYSCNLANSEPSVFETQKLENGTVMVPYSKVGLAKSSGNILGNAFSSKGYSKFGFPPSKSYYAVDVVNANPTIDLIMVDQSSGKIVSKNKMANKNTLKNTHFPNSYLKTTEKTSHNVDTEQPKLSPGYVSVGDMRGTKESDTANQLSDDADDFIDSSDDNHQPWIMKDIQVDGSSSDLSYTYDQHLIDFHNSSPLKGFSNGSNLPAVSSLYFNEDARVNNFQNDSKSDCEASFQSNELKSSMESQSLNSSGSSEILLTPVINRNGYVPFSNFSSSERTLMCVPNGIESSVSLSVFPSDVCTEFDQNYITPSNKSDLKFLQETLVPKSNHSSKVIPYKSKDTFSGGKIYTLNGNNISKISEPLKYLLKPLPKMESEICEV